MRLDKELVECDWLVIVASPEAIASGEVQHEYSVFTQDTNKLKRVRFVERYPTDSRSGYTKQVVLGGEYNVGFNAGSSVKLLISDYDNDTSADIYPIYVEDEQNRVDFFVRKQEGSISSAYFGGSVGVGASPDPNTPLRVEGGADAGPAGGGFLVLGPTSGSNLALDNEEIMARNNGSVSTLRLNNDGGDVIVGDDLVVNGKLDIGFTKVLNSVNPGESVAVDCPVGLEIVSGGCEIIGTSAASLTDSYARTITNGWFCQSTSSVHLVASALCAKLKTFL